VENAAVQVVAVRRVCDMDDGGPAAFELSVRQGRAEVGPPQSGT
jgi:hypothetical protein